MNFCMKDKLHGFVYTQPTFSKKAWIWHATKSGKKSYSSTGWDIVNDIVRQLNCQLIDFMETYNVSVYNNHIELDKNF